MLLEAVPNLSFGPTHPGRAAVLDRLEAEQSPGWALLDEHTDPDHARTVLTLAGAPAPLARALGAMVEAASDHGDVRQHRGVHPYVGVVDVVPVVALHGARPKDARRTAEHAARALAGHQVPVHYYGALATRENHRVLAPIRATHRWTKEGLRDHLPPDLGPPAPHPRLGCACVGVRGLMVAYNVLLDTIHRGIGEAIARALRTSGGGLPGVQSLAFPLESRGRAMQVSCNLTQPWVTGPARVFQEVHALAAEHGVGVAGGELVGLAPQACLPEDPTAMGLDERPGSLEARLAACGLPGHPTLPAQPGEPRGGP